MADRVLMVNDIADVGGGATAMLDVAEVLLADGIEVHLASPPGHLPDRARQLGVSTHDFWFHERRMLTEQRRPRPVAVRERLRESRRIERLAQQVGADAVHSGALVPHLDTALVRRPIVWHVNQVHPSYLAAGPLPDRIVSVSEAALAPLSWRAAARLRATVVPNGIDTTRFRPADDVERKDARTALGLGDEPVVITVARLEKTKGVDTVLAGAARSATRPVVLVVGDGPHRPEHEGVDVRFLGTRGDVDVLLRAADVFAFGSTWEAFGLAVAEASATGLPVVALPAGGCAEVVADGRTGILVDGVASMARAFDRLFGDACLRTELGRAGRERVVTRFDRSLLADRLLPVYRGLR